MRGNQFVVSKRVRSGLKERPAMGLPVLYLNYHEIRVEKSPYLYSLPADEFDAHLRLVRAAAVDARAALRITFDDGHRTQYETAFPVLTRHKTSAIFFVTAGFTGVSANHMTWSQLRELADAGHEIQAHGWVHRVLPTCTDAELDEELRRPKETIEDRLGRAVDALSIPGGRFDARVLEACRNAGYLRAFTSELWPPAWEQNGLEMFSRRGILRRTSASTLSGWMRSGGRPTVGARVLRQMKAGVRRTLGDERYHRLWCLLANGNPGPISQAVAAADCAWPHDECGNGRR